MYKFFLIVFYFFKKQKNDYLYFTNLDKVTFFLVFIDRNKAKRKNFEITYF